MDLPNTMGAINHTQNALLPTNSYEPFEWESHTRHANNRVKDSSPGFEALLASLPNDLTEPTLKFILSDRVLELDFPRLKRAVFRQGDNAFLHGAIDRLKVNQGFSSLEVQVVQHGRHTRRGVLDEDTFVSWSVEELRDICTRPLQEFCVLLPDVRVWCPIGQV